MELLRRSSEDPLSETVVSKKQRKAEGKKKKKDSKPSKVEKFSKERVRKDGANPELAARLREYGENYGLEEDPYLEGLSNAIDEGKNLAIWASNDVMTLLPRPDLELVEGPIYAALVLLRNVLVFVPVALTWLSVGKATTAFSIYTAKNSASSIVNFLQFWQNGYGVLSEPWTLSHIAEDDFIIIATVIFLTFITPFINRSAIRRATSFEQDALRERLKLVIEVESFLFDKGRLTPLLIESSLAESFERVVQATNNLAVASKRIEIGLHALPRQVDSSLSLGEEGSIVLPPEKFSRRAQKLGKQKVRELEILQHHSVLAGEHQILPTLVKFNEDEKRRIESAAVSLESASKRVDLISQTLPRRAHARKELKKVELELIQTRCELNKLQERLQKQHRKSAKKREWEGAKSDADREKVLSQTKKTQGKEPFSGDR